MFAEYTFLHSQGETLRKMFGLTEYIDPPKTDMFPGYSECVFKEEEGGDRRMHTFHWGLIPRWAKEPKEGRKFFNARSETVHEKRTYRDAFKSRCCLVSVTGWYEWKQGTKPKQKYVIAAKESVPFVLLGSGNSGGGRMGRKSVLTVS